MNKLLRRVINFIRQLKGKKDIPRIYNLHCPAGCGYEWQFATNSKINQVIRKVCPKCGRSYVVTVCPWDVEDNIVYMMVDMAEIRDVEYEGSGFCK